MNVVLHVENARGANGDDALQVGEAKNLSLPFVRRSKGAGNASLACPSEALVCKSFAFPKMKEKSGHHFHSVVGIALLLPYRVSMARYNSCICNHHVKRTSQGTVGLDVVPLQIEEVETQR